MQEFARGNETH